jgi:hypothetical protein
MEREREEQGAGTLPACSCWERQASKGNRPQTDKQKGQIPGSVGLENHESVLQNGKGGQAV